MRLANAIEQCPTHDAHEGFRPERLTALDLQLDLPCVIGLVAGLAERYQVVGRIPAGLTLKVVERPHETLLGVGLLSQKSVKHTDFLLTPIVHL